MVNNADLDTLVEILYDQWGNLISPSERKNFSMTDAENWVHDQMLYKKAHCASVHHYDLNDLYAIIHFNDAY